MEGSTAASCILVPDRPRIGDGKSAVGVPLRRHVNVGFGKMKWGCSSEEDWLLYYEIVEFGDNFIIESHHFRGLHRDGGDDLRKGLSGYWF